VEQQLYSLQNLKIVAHSKGRHYRASFALQANLYSALLTKIFQIFTGNRIKLTLFLFFCNVDIKKRELILYSVTRKRLESLNNTEIDSSRL